MAATPPPLLKTLLYRFFVVFLTEILDTKPKYNKKKFYEVFVEAERKLPDDGEF